jgi:hypothetical protein
MSEEKVERNKTERACNTIKARAYAITWNNYTEDEYNLLNQWCKINCEDYRLGKEVGKNKTPHIQGTLIFENPRSFDAIKNIMPKAHIERCKNPKASLRYCEKAGNYEGPETEPIEDTVIQPRPWQQQVLDLIKTKPDNRTIHWYYDEDGGKGKTTLARHICINNKDALYVAGKSADIKYGVTSWIGDGKKLKTLIIDLVRSSESYVSYDGIESVKNGIFYNTKYESKMVIFNNPHIIVFANFKPKMESLSQDRWNIITL